MEILWFFKYAIWGLLLLGSIVALAVALEFGVLRRRLRTLRKNAEPLWQRVRGRLKQQPVSIARSVGEEDELFDLDDALRSDAHPVSRYYRAILSRSAQLYDPTVAAQTINLVERGRLRLINFIASLAPLIGLAGTVVGIMESLTGGVTGGPEGELIEHFGFALESTLAGIFLAVMARAVGALGIEPTLDRIEAVCRESESEPDSSIGEAGLPIPTCAGPSLRDQPHVPGVSLGGGGHD